MMAQAYISDRQDAGNYWRAGKGTIPQWDLQAQAIREAGLILAETEPALFGHDGTQWMWNHHVRKLTPNTDRSLALVFSLRAILPALEEMAADATRETILPEHERASYIAALHMRDRNRATLAAMEAEGRA